MRFHQILAGFTLALFGPLMGCGRSNEGEPTVRSISVDDDQVVIMESGWDKAALDRILSDFERKYGLRDSALRSESAGGFRVRLNQPLGADQVLYLINYIHYPEGFDLKGKSPVAAVARARLNDAFGATTPALRGKVATFYVPADDTEYDEVYAELDNGALYRLSFTNLTWVPVARPRQSKEVEMLKNSMAPLADH